MTKRTVLTIAFFFFILAGSVILLTGSHKFYGSVLQTPKFEGDVFLRSASKPVHLREYRGRVVLLYFGYTSCPDVCPTSLAKLKSAFDQLTAEETSQIQVIFVSVDPQRDTFEKLEEYVHVFHKDFIGASGTEGEVNLLTDSLGVYYKINAPDASGNYTVDHSSLIYVINPQGYLVMSWSHDIQPDQIAEDLHYLLKKGIPISNQILAGPTPTPVICSLTLEPFHVQGGEWLYAHNCAQCHGTDLKGNPAWETELEDGSRLPPPLDGSGTTWQKSPGELLEIIQNGRNLDKPIHMPAFEGTLEDWEMQYILEYMASKWDMSQRNYYAGLLTLTPQPTVIYTPTPNSTPTSIP